MHKDTYILDGQIREQLKDSETGKLIGDLIRYTKTLQSMVIDLRKEVNNLNPEKPYQDLHSDLYQPFEPEDYPALERLKDYIEPSLIDWDDYSEDF